MWEALKEMPVLDFPLNIICFIMNIFVPGRSVIRHWNYDSLVLLWRLQQGDVLDGRIPALHKRGTSRVGVVSILGISDMQKQKKR